MNYCAYELLSLVYDCEYIEHPEMIPSPARIRKDPEFSDALDYLLDQGFIEVRKSRPPLLPDKSNPIEMGFFEPYTETLRTTPEGARKLAREERARIAFRCY